MLGPQKSILPIVGCFSGFGPPIITKGMNPQTLEVFDISPCQSEHIFLRAMQCIGSING